MRRGAIAAAGAAAAFGVTVPLVQRFGRHAGPWLTAALLYAGAVLVSGYSRAKSDARLARHAGRIVLIAVLGAAVAPALLAMGLRRMDGASASLLLAFEASFTALFARILYRETISRRVLVALALTFAGGVVLVRPDLGVPRLAVGSLLVLAAVLCWAADSAIMRPLAVFPVARVVRAKSLVGVCVSLLVSVALRESVPGVRDGAALALCGALGYGITLRLYLVAQRNVGAARTASVFSIAPFFGAIVALALGQRASLPTLGLAGALLALGVAAQATEKRS